MTRRRLAALLAALLLLPGEAARAAVWCGAANAVATRGVAAQAAVHERAPDAQPASMNQMDQMGQMDHARHHAMMLAPAADSLPSAPRHAPPPSHHGATSECPLMAACASAAVALPVTLTDVPVVLSADAAHASVRTALDSRAIAPEPPPPR